MDDRSLLGALSPFPPPLRVATSFARAERVGEGGTQERLPMRTPTPNPSPQGGGEREGFARSRVGHANA